MKKKLLITFLIISICITTYLFIKQEGLSLSLISDCLFMIGLAYLCVGAGLAIISSGFFDTFQKSMKGLLKKNEVTHVTDDKNLSQTVKANSLLYWFIVSGICLTISLLLLMRNI